MLTSSVHEMEKVMQNETQWTQHFNNWEYARSNLLSILMLAHPKLDSTLSQKLSHIQFEDEYVAIRNRNKNNYHLQRFTLCQFTNQRINALNIIPSFKKLNVNLYVGEVNTFAHDK